MFPDCGPAKVAMCEFVSRGNVATFGELIVNFSSTQSGIIASFSGTCSTSVSEVFLVKAEINPRRIMSPTLQCLGDQNHSCLTLSPYVRSLESQF